MPWPNQNVASGRQRGPFQFPDVTAPGFGTPAANGQKEIGADPTGVVDASAIFQRAVTANEASGGGPIAVPPGTYLIGTALTGIVKTTFLIYGATFTGAGASSVGPALVVSNTGDLVARSLTVLASGPYAPSALAVALGSNASGFGTVGILPPPKGGGQDDSATMQAAIDAMSAAGGGELWGYGDYTANVVLKQGVILRGPFTTRTPWTSIAFRINAFATGYVIDTPAGATNACGVIGVGFQGLGAGTAGGAVRFRNVIRGICDLNTANNFADEAFVQVTGSACFWGNNFAQNCLLNTTRAAIIGVLDIGGTDHWITKGEYTASEAAVSSGSLFICAILIRGTNCFIYGPVGEFADNGIYVLGNTNRFVAARASNNVGHGWNVFGSGNQFLGCNGIDNSQDTTNTYDNWRADSTSSGNQYTGCQSSQTAAKLTKYGFEDLVQNATNFNRYEGCLHIGAVGTQAYLIQTNSGSSFEVAHGGTMHTLAVNSATPDVTGYERFSTNNSAATTITAFTGGVQGQRILIFCLDSNTTVQHNGATISLRGGGNKKLLTGVMYEFVLNGGVWNDIRSYPLSVSVDVGDAAKNIKADIDESTQIWATPLTANRAVTLNVTGAYIGATFRIVRKASATGASTLDVGAGPLKSLAAGQWCDVQYDGAAWFLSAFGSL